MLLLKEYSDEHQDTQSTGQDTLLLLLLFVCGGAWGMHSGRGERDNGEIYPLISVNL